MPDDHNDSWEPQFSSPELANLQQNTETKSPRQQKRQEREELDNLPEILSLEQMIILLKKEMQKVHRHQFDFDDAPRMAALALLARENLINHLHDFSLSSKRSKFEAKISESEVAIRYRSQKKEKDGPIKLTDAAIKEMIPSDPAYKSAEFQALEFEAEYEKAKNLLNFLADTHVFFRNLKAL